MTGSSPDRLSRLADLLVGFGANVQPGQVVDLGAEIGQEEFARAVAEAAYRHGARFVDTSYFDLHVKRARLLHADPETLEYVPPWYGARVLALGEERAARIRLAGPVAPTLLDDVDPERAGRDHLPMLKESLRIVNDRSTNWTIGPAPTAGWAAVVYPELDAEAALARLWDDMVHVLRLDEADPVKAWEERMGALLSVGARLGARAFDALHIEGPGTDLLIGLLPRHRWLAAEFETSWGLVHHPNLPSEEVFTTPDPERTSGVVRSTRPLLLSGSRIEGLRIRFEQGRAVEIDADRGAEIMRAHCATDEGAARLGEVALVDRHGRVGAVDRIFSTTLLDENAASHIALGAGYAFALPDSPERANQSAIHTDFMIGSPDVQVTGLTEAGERVPVLVGGDWQI